MELGKNQKIINQLKRQGEEIKDEVLAHISLLPYKHVLPQGTYFVENKQPPTIVQNVTV